MITDLQFFDMEITEKSERIRFSPCAPCPETCGKDSHKVYEKIAVLLISASEY
jgi:hypothetical protein